MEIYFVYITCPKQNVAQEIAQMLIEKRLIGCANIFPISSVFSWQDSINHENEYVLLVKTVPEHADIIEELVEKIHPNTIPCISKIKTNVNEKFYKWVRQQVS